MAHSHRRRGPGIVLGPVLHFRGVQGERWRLSALFARTGEGEPADLAVDGVRLPVPPRYIAHHGNIALWRFDFAVPRGPNAGRVGYGFPGGERWYFPVPGREEPLRLAYVAGSGPSAGSDAPSAASPGPWSQLMSRHRAEPFHLLLQGGGQIDARGIWNAGPEISAWSARPARERKEQAFSATMDSEAADFLADLYVRHWRQPERAALHASLPSVMTPAGLDFGEDDTAAFRDNASLPVAQGARDVARRWASLFQLGTLPEKGELWDQAFRIDDTGVLGLDLRTGPDDASMLAPGAWDALPGWLGKFDGVRHLLVLSASAVALPVRRGLGSLAPLWHGSLRAGEEAGFEWRRKAHEAEWLKLVRTLGDFAHRSRARVTILSGVPGVAAQSLIRGPDHEIGQLLCPPLAQTPAGKAVGDLFARAARRPETVTDGLALAVQPFPGTDSVSVADRGWLALTFTPASDMDAEWTLGGADRLRRRIEAIRPPAFPGP